MTEHRKPIAGPRFYSPAEVAEILSISTQTVSGLIRKGEIRAISVSGTVKKRWRVSAEDLKRYTDSRETNEPMTATRTSRNRLQIKRYV